MKNATMLACFLFIFFVVQAQQKSLETNKAYKSIALAKSDVLDYSLNLSKNGIYQFSIEQQGIAVHYQLMTPEDKMVYESNYPDDIVGFDNLKNCKTFSDSADTFQKFYLDRATNGLLDFIQARELTAEKFVDAISKN